MTAADYGQSLAQMWAARWLIQDINDVLAEVAEQDATPTT